MTAELYLEAMKIKITGNKATNIDQVANRLLGNAHKTDPANRMDIAQSFRTSGQVYDEFCKTAHSHISEICADHVRASWSSLGGGIDLLWKRIHSAQLEDLSHGGSA
jgi:ribosomal protein L17